jgi:5-formyltetrahydrofolate cyclo-ligase
VSEQLSVPELKRSIRAALLASRANLAAVEIETARAGVRHVVLEQSAAWRCAAAYRPLRTEPGSTQLLNELVTAGIQVLVPELRPDRDLDWTDWTVPDRLLGRHAIAHADVVLVPALAVDRTGVRLGRGGGSYDRALRRVPAGVPIVALVYDEEIVPELPADSWDTPVTAAATPGGWVALGGSEWTGNRTIPHHS